MVTAKQGRNDRIVLGWSTRGASVGVTVSQGQFFLLNFLSVMALSPLT